MTQINKGKQNVTRFVYSVYEFNSRIFFLSRQVILDWIIHFPLADNFFFWGGGHAFG